MIRPALWRKLFKPRYAEMFKKVHDAGRRRNAHMHVWFHSDGHINDIFGDLIEIGVDAINSQVKVVGLDWVAQNVRGKIAFRTDIDRQHVMPFGSPSQVKEEVHRVFEACGTPDGGIIAGKSAPKCRWRTSQPCIRRSASTAPVASAAQMATIRARGSLPVFDLAC